VYTARLLSQRSRDLQRDLLSPGIGLLRRRVPAVEHALLRQHDVPGQRAVLWRSLLRPAAAEGLVATAAAAEPLRVWWGAMRHEVLSAGIGVLRRLRWCTRLQDVVPPLITAGPDGPRRSRHG